MLKLCKTQYGPSKTFPRTVFFFFKGFYLFDKVRERKQEREHERVEEGLQGEGKAG